VLSKNILNVFISDVQDRLVGEACMSSRLIMHSSCLFLLGYNIYLYVSSKIMPSYISVSYLIKHLTGSFLDEFDPGRPNICSP
jgi:hypothetical protein